MTHGEGGRVGLVKRAVSTLLSATHRLTDKALNHMRSMQTGKTGVMMTDPEAFLEAFYKAFPAAFRPKKVVLNQCLSPAAVCR